MNKYERALLDPLNVYELPMEVVEDANLTREQKIQILHRWEYDARELQIAEEENMLDLTGEQQSNMLSCVLTALHALGASAKHN